MSTLKFLPLPTGSSKSPDVGKAFSILPDALGCLEDVAWHEQPAEIPITRRLGPGDLTMIVNEIRLRGECWGLVGVRVVRERDGFYFELRWRIL